MLKKVCCDEQPKMLPRALQDSVLIGFGTAILPHPKIRPRVVSGVERFGIVSYGLFCHTMSL